MKHLRCPRCLPRTLCQLKETLVFEKTIIQLIGDVRPAAEAAQLCVLSSTSGKLAIVLYFNQSFIISSIMKNWSILTLRLNIAYLIYLQVDIFAAVYPSREGSHLHFILISLFSLKVLLTSQIWL